MFDLILTYLKFSNLELPQNYIIRQHHRVVFDCTKYTIELPENAVFLGIQLFISDLL